MRRLSAAILLFAPVAFGAEKNPWVGFKPGSYSKLKTTSTVGPVKTITEMTQTLLSIDSTNAVVEFEITTMGQSTRTRTTIPLNSTAITPANSPQPKILSTTNETISLTGKSLACKCSQTETNANSMKTTAKSCVSETVPGGVVKVVSNTSGPMRVDSVIELVDFLAK